MACTHRQLNRLAVEEGDVGSSRHCCVHVLVASGGGVLALTVVEVGVEQADSYRHGHVLVQFAEITEVQCPLVRTNGS